jgi:hypothetical protein
VQYAQDAPPNSLQSQRVNGVYVNAASTREVCIEDESRTVRVTAIAANAHIAIQKLTPRPECGHE